MCSKKRFAGRSFFQNSGSQGPGRVSPGGSLRAAPSSRFFMFFKGLVGLNCVVKLPHKASVNFMTFDRENQIDSYLGKKKVCIFY